MGAEVVQVPYTDEVAADAPLELVEAIGTYAMKADGPPICPQCGKKWSNCGGHGGVGGNIA